MRILLPAIAAMLIMASCKSSKDYLSRSNEDRTLYDIVKQLNKKGDDPLAQRALPIVYEQVQQKHLQKIAALGINTDLSRWNRMLSEYNILQSMYLAITDSDASLRQVTPVSYQNSIDSVRQGAAADYYQLATGHLSTRSRAAAKLAYNAFNEADQWIKGYKDSKAKMDEVWEDNMIVVVINPITDNSNFRRSSYNSNVYNLSNENMPQNIVRALGGKRVTRYPAEFYTIWQADNERLRADWVADLILRDVEMPRPGSTYSSRNLSKKIEAGKDTSGNIIYQTVYATLNIQRQSFTARADMDVVITDASTKRSMYTNSFADTYYWQQEKATYTGDSRALSNNEWTLVNAVYHMPTREEILEELYKGLYPKVKNGIDNAVSW